jgi:hypothetical protein
LFYRLSLGNGVAMRTPAGKDCPHYYADFNRGRRVQECRLIEENNASPPWQSNDCAQCQVPDILRANASPLMELKLTVRAGLVFGIGRHLDISATCDKHSVPIPDPFVGCEQCNAERPTIQAFLDSLERDSPNDPITP